MQLLYFYAEFLDRDGSSKPFRGMKDVQLSLSSRYSFEYEKYSCVMNVRPRKKPLPDNFWENEYIKENPKLNIQSNIRNLHAIAGENGSGKSSIIQYLIDLLYSSYLAASRRNFNESGRHNPWNNHNLLLFEDNDNTNGDPTWYLYNYNPIQEDNTNHIKIYRTLKYIPKVFQFAFRNPLQLHSALDFITEDLDQESFYARKEIVHLLKKTKVIYMSNTLTQRDYLLHINSDYNERLRDYFVYDCSLGATIGPNIAAFFPYEMYKQVKYVFDGKQYKIRSQLKEVISEFPSPRTLRLRPRIPEYQEMLSQHLSNESIKGFKPQISSAIIPEEIIHSSLACILSYLCVLSYGFNVIRHCDNTHLLNEVWNQIVEVSPRDTLCLEQWKQRIEIVYDAATLNNQSQKVVRGHTNMVLDLKNLCMDYLEFIDINKDIFFAKFQQTEDHEYYELIMDSIKDDNSIFTKMVTFMQKYRYTCEPEFTISFNWGLSSGEENMLRMFSNLYHIFDRDYNIERYGDYTVYNNESHSSNNKQPCDSIILFMDEADLTLHPEWQRRLVHILTAFLPAIYPVPKTKDVQIMLTTHSPLLLGDVPEENITYLSADGTIASGETFGQNIHTILKNSFFLGNGTVGEFAAAKINSTAKQLKEMALNKRNTQIQVSESTMNVLRMNVSLVASGILRNQLDQLLEDAEYALHSADDISQKKLSVDRLIEATTRLSSAERERLINALLQQRGKHD